MSLDLIIPRLGNQYEELTEGDSRWVYFSVVIEKTIAHYYNSEELRRA